MYLNIFIFLSITVSVFLALMIVIQKTVIKKQTNTAFAGLIAAAFLLYILFAAAAVIILPNYISKLIMVIFGLSPFIIGKMVTYKTEGLFSFIQIVCAVSTGAFMYLNWVIG